MNKIISLVLSISLLLGLCACNSNPDGTNNTLDNYDKTYIEESLNLANNDDQEWTYNENADAWVMSVVSAVAADSDVED